MKSVENRSEGARKDGIKDLSVIDSFYHPSNANNSLINSIIKSDGRDKPRSEVIMRSSIPFKFAKEKLQNDDFESSLKKTENKRRKYVNKGNCNNMKSEIDQDIAQFPFKSAKRKSSWGLGFTVQILKDAKHLFNKKKIHRSIVKESKNGDKNHGNGDSINNLNDIFPHIINAPDSCRKIILGSEKHKIISGNISPITTLSSSSFLSSQSSFKSSSSSSNSSKYKHWNKQQRKINKENGQNKDENLVMKNGNFHQKTETILNEKNYEKSGLEYSRKNVVFSKEIFKPKRCFCTNRKRKSKRFRKHKTTLPVLSKQGGGKISYCDGNLSSEAEKTYKDEEILWRRISCQEYLKNRNIFRNKTIFQDNGEPLASCLSSSHCDSFNDEEDVVDTPVSSSDAGLTSNLSLFTSVEGEDEALDLLPKRDLRPCLGRGDLLKNVDDLDDLDRVMRDLSTHEVTAQNYYKVSTHCDTSKSNWNGFRRKRKGGKTALSTRETTNPRPRIPNSKFCPQMTRENKYFEYQHLATPSERVATIGISSMINKDLEFLRGSTPNRLERGYKPLFYLNRSLMRKIIHDKSSIASLSSATTKTASSSLQDSMKGNFGQFSLSQDQEYLDLPVKGSQDLCHSRANCELSAKLENVTQQYEERLTELHSVIAELTRKLEKQKEDVILEEEEEDEEDVREEFEDEINGTYNGGRRRKSNNRSNKEGFSLSELSSHEQNATTEYSTSDTAESEGMYNEEECHDAAPQPSTDVSTSCDIDDRAVEAGQCIADLEVEECRAECNSNISICQPSHDNGTNGTDEIVGDDVMGQESSSVGLEEEMKVLREENLNLQQALALSHHKASSQRAVIMALSREREMFKRKVKELERMHLGIPHSSTQVSDAIMVKGLRGSPLSGALSTPVNSSLDISVHNTSRAVSPSINSQPQEEESLAQEGVKVICKLAERVRLKKAESGDFRVTGSELSNYGISTAGVAEQLAAGLQEESDAQELYHALATAGGAFAPHERLKEYELEAERLHSRIDHLRAQNDVLTATLCESKACCDRLALKTGRAEAQSGALRMGVEVLDQIQDAFEVLTALHEAQIGLLAVTCQVTGVDLGSELGFEPLHQDVDPLIRIKRAQEQRRTAENVARHLISRLEEETRPKSLFGATDSNGIHSMSSSTSSFCSEGAHQEEHMLREMISRLQKERTKILSGFKGGGDSSPMEDYFPLKPPLNEEDAHKFDLENAVLMQELTAIREDRAELRAQVYLLEREKTGLELRVGTCEAQAAAYCATIDHLKSQLNESKSSPNNPQEIVEDSGAETASSEAESLRRESQLKSRIDDLISTLEKVNKNSEARHQQSQEFISDLKKANSALLTAIDRLKKKYALRVKRMEQQALNLVAEHEEQVKILKNRISALEEQIAIEHCSPHPHSMISSIS